MGTEVLRPHDCLTHRTRLSSAVFPRRKIHCRYGNGIPKLNRKLVIRSERLEQIKQSPVNRRRSPEDRQKSPEPLTVPKRSASAGDLRYKQQQKNNNNNNNLVHGKVMILRRGESLGQIVKAHDKTNSSDGTGRLGPYQETVTKQVRIGLPDVYAGSAASMSPSPRAVPLPSFFKKVDEKLVDDSATKDLRRLLRLD